MKNKLFKNLIGMLFNISGAYLLFMPYSANNFQSFPYFSIGFVKVIGVIGLLFSYYIFHLKETSSKHSNKTQEKRRC